MHPIDKVLKSDDQSEFQNRGTEFNAFLIHMADAPKTDENEESEVLKFIDQHSPCA